MILEKNEKFEISESMIPPKMTVTIEDARIVAETFGDLRMRYHAAIKEISTKLEVLDNEFSLRHDYCLLYTSPSPRDRTRSRMPSSA